MKKRRLNKKGKIMVTILTFLISTIIYALMAILGAFVKTSIIILLIVICGYIWLFFGQIMAYYIVWGE